MALNLWTREELILALNLYLKLPYGKLHSRTPEIIQLANIIGRTPGAVAMRLNNFAHVDPYHQQRGVIGLANGKRQVEPIWNEFINNHSERAQFRFVHLGFDKRGETDICFNEAT